MTCMMGLMTCGKLIIHYPTPIDIFQEDYYQEYLNNNNHPLRLALIDNDVMILSLNLQ